MNFEHIQCVLLCSYIAVAIDYKEYGAFQNQSFLLEFQQNEQANETQCTHSVTSLRCVLQYFEEHLLSKRQTRKVIYFLKTDETSLTLEDHFLQQINQQTPKWIIRNVNTKQKISLRSVSGEIKDFVRFSSGQININDFKPLMRFINRQDRLHLIIVCEASREYSETVFKSLNKFFALNIKILAWQVDSWALLSVENFQNNCETKSLDVVEEFHIDDDTSQCQSSIVTDQQESKCVLKVAGGHYEPYVYYNQAMGFYKGIEFYMIETIAQRLGLSIEYHLINSTDHSLGGSDAFAKLSAG